MKQNIHHLYYLYYPRNWTIIALLLFGVTILAQEQTPLPKEFIVGTAIGVPDNVINNETLQNNLNAVELNTISFPANDNTQSFLSDYSLLAWNVKSELEYIYHYSSSYYSKWEAEQNQTNPGRIGFKHYDTLGNTYGSTATWEGKECWSTIGLSSPTDFLMYGPHYRQDKKYKRWYDSVWEPKIQYVVRFNIALTKDPSVQDNEDVCKIKVVFRYKQGSDFYDRIFKSRILKVSNFNSDSSFADIYLHESPDSIWYDYPSDFIAPRNLDKIVEPPIGTINYIDYEEKTGIQYCVEWLRNDNKCTLYIDYVEVYDNYGWNEFIADPGGVSNLIKNYADSFKTMSWDNIMYWGGVDEPSVIDAFIPVQTVNSILVDSAAAPPLINTFNPTWTWNHLVNGEMQMKQYINIAQPYEFLIAMNPGSPEYPSLTFNQLDWLRYNFQLADSIHPNFWYAAQTHGLKTAPDGEWHIWRKPNPSELSAIVMLALAHGAKGIIFMWFDSYGGFPPIGSGTYWECIVKEDGTPLNTYDIIKDNLVPRLKGKLGNTMLNLDYTGNYIQSYYEIPSQNPLPDPQTIDYLTLGYGYYTAHNMFWHCGFFDKSGQPENKYFLLANLYQGAESKTVRVKVSSLNQNYNNWRFRNIEGYFDETFSNYIIKDLTHSKGEGYLYHVAPVIKYGGRLLYSEATQPGMILEDDMIIENGAVLTVNEVYSSKGNITIKYGGIINGDNGKIQFAEGKKLIIEGSGSISGTSNDKLELNFNESQNDEITGITINSGGSLTISNCIVEDATIGVNSLLNANYLNAQNVDFINCETHSISIAGRNPGMNLTPPPQIKNCTMLNSNWGIVITNLPGMLIQNNIITNTACGIYLSNVTDAQIINNLIQSDRYELEGLILLSSGANILANTITGHSVGLHFANSFPTLGSNGMTLNKFHGLYIGSNSVPFMRAGKFIGRPPNFYATSGYNKIYENGGYEGEGDDNDGSEIYFAENSNAEIDKGCNRIYDDREPLPPLVNTLLLMNCPDWPPIEVDARGNYWGSWVDESRFGRNLIVEYIPYKETPCPEPQFSSTGELFRMSSYGDVIDTVYAVDIEIPELTETEEAYAEAEEYFLTGSLTNALQIYEGIINSTATEEEKYLAYQRKYSIGKLTGQSIEYFNQLSNTFSELASNTQDTLNKKMLNQLSTLSKVGEQEYETAITEFDNIVQQNPNTEEAVYAEIDALTTALLLEEVDTTLQKGRLGKYLIKSTSDYNQRIDEILRKHFGGEPKEQHKDLIPTEYTLYQNYPNPFNPVTTIKYDLPFASDVSLVIYDILGRKVKELVNTKQQAGRYQVQFDASNLASGVYIYQLIAEKYLSSKKMILLK